VDGELIVFADNILITEEGYENLTPTPKEVDELKKIIMSG
jgi:Xaa-Pro dipeptidase